MLKIFSFLIDNSMPAMCMPSKYNPDANLLTITPIGTDLTTSQRAIFNLLHFS